MKPFIYLLLTFSLLFFIKSYAQFVPNVPDELAGTETTSSITTPVTGTLKVVFIEYSYPDHPVTVAKYTDRYNSAGNWYKALGTFPNGATLQQEISNNGPVEVADFLGEAVTDYFETMSHGKVTVEFEIPRNPAESSGIWYTANNRSSYTNVSNIHKSIMDGVYAQFPSLISNANCIAFFSSKTTATIYDHSRSINSDLTLSDGTIVYTGPYVYSRVFHWPQNTQVLAHEIAHRIEKSLNPSSLESVTLPDRGIDVVASVYRPGFSTHNCWVTSGTYDLMYHNSTRQTENSLYGQIPLTSYDLIRLGWIESDEILEITPSSTSTLQNVKIADMRKQLTTQQKSDNYYRIVKIYLNENFYSSRDEYYLIEYHRGTDYDRHFYNYDEGVSSGLLIWHIVETGVERNPAMDILTAVPYNGFYGNPLPDDSYPKTWQIFNYPSNFTGILKDNEYDWLNDLAIDPPDFGPFSVAENGGRHIYEVLNTDGANWYRTNSKKDDFFTNSAIKGRINNKILPTTRPSSKDWWGENTNLGIINIEHITTTYTDHMKFDFYNNYWNGTISEDLTINGNVKVYGTLEIEEGVTLTIEQGTTLEFEENAWLVVNGTLTANGTSVNSIVFTSSNTSPGVSDWQGIIVNGNATIDHATIEYANNGIGFWASNSGTVSNCTIRNNNRGIYAYHTSPEISNCEIYDNDYNGIEFDNTNNYGTADILNNEIHDNDDAGIQLTASSPDIRGNEIYNNHYGVSCVTSSSPHLGETGAYGNNNIYSNYYGIYANSYCDPFLGQDGCTVNGGNNQITSSTSYHVLATYYSDVMAEENWWGSNPPSAGKFQTHYGATIDYTPYLTSAPSMMLMAGNSPEESVFNQAFSEEISNTANIDVRSYFNDKWTLRQKLSFAHNIIHLNAIEFAEEICRNIIYNTPDSTQAILAMNILWEASRNENAGKGYDLNSFRSYLEELVQQKQKKPIYGYAEIILADFDDKTHILHLDNVYNNYQDTHVAPVALFSKFKFYYIHENIDAAKSILEQMKTEYSESELTGLAASYFEKPATGNVLAKESFNDNKSEAETGLPKEYSLSSNYPNPFNNSTTFSFGLPEASHVTIEIFNILGEKVKTIAANRILPGYHTMAWDGLNHSGQSVTSGVYLYHFKAESMENNRLFVRSEKMILIK